MRHGLLGIGWLATLTGCALWWDGRTAGMPWIIVGAVFLAVGLATCEIIAVIESQASRENGTCRADQFREAAQAQDQATMVRLLTAGGIPESLARQTVQHLIDSGERHPL